MGNCCANPDKEELIIVSNEEVEVTLGAEGKGDNGDASDSQLFQRHSQQQSSQQQHQTENRQNDHQQHNNDSDNNNNNNTLTITNNNQKSQQVSEGNLPMTSSLTLSATTKNIGLGGVGSANNLPNQQQMSSVIKTPSSQFLQQRNNPSEIDSTNANNRQSGNTKDDALSQHRLDTQERELTALTEQYIVSTVDQLQNPNTAKFVFMCRSDSSKSFILFMSHATTSQANSAQQLFDIASKRVQLAYGMPAVSMQFQFGVLKQRSNESAQQQSDCFPAYFKTKEVFEDTFPIMISMQGNPNKIRQVGFPSMTVEDLKNEFMKTDETGMFCPSSTSVFRYASQDEMRSSGYRSALIEIAVNGGIKQTVIQMQDHEKFAMAGVNTHDELSLIFRKAEEDAQSEAYWSMSNPSNTESHASEEILLTSNKSEEITRAVKIGVNVEIECREPKCKLKGKRVVKALGIGTFDLIADAAKWLVCSGCSKSTLIEVHQIAFFSCRYAYTGAYGGTASGVSKSKKKRSSAKWSIAFQQMTAKRLDVKTVVRDSKNTSHHNSWSGAFNEMKWNNFKVYSKRISHVQKHDANEELMHQLQIEADSQNMMCGVCKQNVIEQMQHTLECGHVFHKICLNMLPTIFKTIACPLWCEQRESGTMQQKYNPNW